MIGLIKLGCRAVFAIGAETPSVCCGDLLIFFRPLDVGEAVPPTLKPSFPNQPHSLQYPGSGCHHAQAGPIVCQTGCPVRSVSTVCTRVVVETPSRAAKCFMF